MAAKEVLMIGSDLHTNGGIGSVVKCYHKAYERNRSQYDINFTLLRTYYYKDKGPVAELFIFIKALFLSVWYLSTRRIDVVHIHSSAGVSFARKTFFVYICKAFGKQTILHLHASRFYDFFLPEGGIKRKWITAVFNRVDLVIALCTDWEHKIRGHYPLANVTTIHNPVDLFETDFSPKQAAERDFQIIFVGFLIESKGIHDLLSLADKLKAEGKQHIKIHIAGKGELEEHILNYIQSHQLQDQVIFEGWVSGQKKDDLYRKADVFFLPSYKEGMPMSILEAMSYSLPIISTNIAGIPDLIQDGDNGYMLEPGNVEGYYRRILELYSSPEMLRTFRERSFERVQAFDTEKILNEVESVYEQLLNDTPSNVEAPKSAQTSSMSK